MDYRMSIYGTLNYTNLQNCLADYCNYIEQEYKSKLAADNLDSGELYKNFKCSYIIDNGKVQVVIEAPDYITYTENGRRPGKFPPKDAIQEFINHRGITPSSNISDDSLVYLISRKIARDGVEGKHYLEPIIQQAESEYKDKLKTAIEKDVAEHIQSQFSAVSFPLR